MNEPTDTITMQAVDIGGDVGIDHSMPWRVMTPAEIKARVELNVQNTASALRARVVAELSKSNGHNNGV